MRIRLVIFFWVGVFVPSIWSQHRNLGTPFIQNYPKTLYGGGTQNWDFAQDKRGIIYVANNEGLLEYNSQDWKIHSLPNSTIVRSVEMGNDDRVYAGGQDEVGYFFPDENGFLRFHSLKTKIPQPYQNFEDVWDLIIFMDQLFFRASERIYCYLEDTVQVYTFDQPLLHLGKANDRLFLQVAGKGLLEFTSKGFHPISQQGYFKNKSVIECLSYSKDTTLIVTEKQGLHYLTPTSSGKWNFDHHSFLSDNFIGSATMLPNQQLAVGTNLGGLIIIAPDRKTQYWLSKENGLKSNNIRSLFVDQGKNLWIGLENGIDYTIISSPFTILHPDGNLEGTSYTARVYNGKIYFGNSNGLYSTAWKDYYDPFLLQDRINIVPGSNGQVWGLNIIDGDLLMGHHEGAFQIVDGTARKISPDPGYWTFLPISQQPGYMISGTYNGLNLYKKGGDGIWKFIRKLPGLEESCRIVTSASTGAFWVSHPYRGIYEAKLTKDLDSLEVSYFNSEHGLPSDLQNYAFYIQNEIIVCSESGIYRFDESSRQFYPYEEFNNLFGENNQVWRLVEDEDGNIWYTSKQETGVIYVTDKGLKKKITKKVFSELKERLVGGFEFIFPIDQQNVLFGAERGYIHFNPSLIQPQDSLIPANINKVYSIDKSDSLLFVGSFNHLSANKKRVYPNRINAFRFHFSQSHYEELTKAEFQYMLVGLDEEWSDWTKKTEREYTNLPAGCYIFKVRSKVNEKQSNRPATFEFEILPPWYATTLAYVVYGILITGMIISIILIPRRKFKKEKQQLELEHKRKEAAHRQEVKQSKEEIMKLKNEKLEAEVKHKNTELASTTMHLVQKNELLIKLQEELKKITNQTEEKKTKRELRKLISLMKRDDHSDEDWEQFSFRFDQVHSNFFKRLKEQYPNLTPKDHKLCAYLRMNLTSKDIAPLMNISVRGVEVSRYRLRKKLDLETSENLTEFLLAF